MSNKIWETKHSIIILNKIVKTVLPKILNKYLSNIYYSINIKKINTLMLGAVIIIN